MTIGGVRGPIQRLLSAHLGPDRFHLVDGVESAEVLTSSELLVAMDEVLEAHAVVGRRAVSIEHGLWRFGAVGSDIAPDSLAARVLGCSGLARSLE